MKNKNKTLSVSIFILHEIMKGGFFAFMYVYIQYRIFFYITKILKKRGKVATIVKKKKSSPVFLRCILTTKNQQRASNEPHRRIVTGARYIT